MRAVSVVGVGMERFGRRPEDSISDIGWPSVRAAIADAGLDRARIEAAYCGTVYGGMMTGQRILSMVGLTKIPIINVENACSSSATAFHLAYNAIARGQFDVALVFGVEKLSQFGGGAIPLVQEDWEVCQGLTMPALYAMRARRYMAEYGLREEELAEVSVKARRHGALNDKAQFQTEISLEDVLNARPIADPFTLLQCCPTGDGAAAVVLCADDMVKKCPQKSVRILASKLCSGEYRGGFRDMTRPEITERCAEAAYEMAGLGPEDIDLAEVHDAFSIAELIYYEAFGFCARGDAYALLRRGDTALGGRIPVNPSGGLLSKGHPLGATGAAQIVEVVEQLRGACGKRQVEGARIGLTHATGGGITGFDHGACAVHVFGA